MLRRTTTTEVRAMLNITVAPEILAKFKELLAEEDNEDAVFRIRETKVGGGCKSHMELRVSLDEREDPDEEQEVQIEGLPFVVNEDVIASYGLTYTIFVGENGVPAVSSPLQGTQTAGGSDGKGTCSLPKTGD